MNSNRASYHEEVVAALRRIGDPDWGERIRVDRGSQLPHFGISFPDLRRVVKAGFSFYKLRDEQVLGVWDQIWRYTPYADVMHAAITYYGPILRRRVPPWVWPVTRHWSDRVDNWAHADGLAGLYSRMLESYPGDVYPVLEEWNDAENEWLRRISLVSLIHYTGKNAVFLPPTKVLPLVSLRLSDPSEQVQKAVGWVLREMGNAYPDEIRAYIEANLEVFSATALSRAIERLTAAERTALRARRKQWAR